MSVLLAFISTGLSLLNRGEKVRSGENLVEILELLAGLDLVRLLDGLLVDFINMGEAVHYECAKKHSVGDFVLLDAEALEVGEGL